MTNSKSLSERAKTKLLKKVILAELVSNKISLPSKNNSKQLKFYLQKIAVNLDSDSEQIRSIGRKLAEEIKTLCSDRQINKLNKTVIDLVSKNFVLTISEDSFLTTTTEVNLLIPSLKIEESNLAVGNNNQAAQEISHSEQKSTATVAQIDLPPEFLNDRISAPAAEIWAEFMAKIGDNPKSTGNPGAITGDALLQSLVCLFWGSEAMAIVNQSDRAIDLPVAKMPDLEVGAYRELQSDLNISIAYGDDGNKYVTKWGSEARGGIYIDPFKILLLVVV